MTQPFDVFSAPQRLNITPTERRLWLDPLIGFLRENPTRVGDVLLGKSEEPWLNQHVHDLERLILAKAGDRKAIRAYLSILHEAAHLWSVSAEKKVKLPRFLGPSTKSDNPFRFDYALAIARYTAWKDRLANWIKGLFPNTGPNCVDRKRLLVAFLVSAILYGGAIGAPFLVAIVRAVLRKRSNAFAISGRIYVELSLTVRGVAEAEWRVWLPDAESGTLWDKLEPNDVSELLAPVVKNDTSRPPSDGEILRRIGRLVKTTLANERQIFGIQDLRRCAREVALSQIKPVLVEYGNCQFLSNSLSRADIWRLFPKGVLLECDPANIPEPGSALETSQHLVDRTGLLDPDWHDALVDTARSKSPRDSLARIATDSAAPLRLVADFGVSLLSSTSTSGKPMGRTRVVDTLSLIARTLGAILESQNLGTLPSVERRRVYLEAINRQPAGARREAITAIRAFDLFLVAQNSTTCPVPRNSFPWLPQDSSVDANLVTHCEYLQILHRIDKDWAATDEEVRRKIARLIVIISFRCNLRRSEIRRLRMSDLLMRASDNPSMLHLVEMLIRRRKNDPLKTKNAVRRICIGALLSRNELEELRSWFDHRILQGATMEEHLFAIPEDKLSRIPKSFFEQLNSFLRGITRFADSGRGIHLHHMRHAAHSWLFASLLLSDLDEPPNLFPELNETNAWLAEGPLIRQLLYRHSTATATKKDPYMLAYCAGHSNFDVTAGSYVHLFPWVLSAFLERSKLMRPSPEEVRRASGKPDSTSRRWFREGGIHNIPLQLFMMSCTRMQPPIIESFATRRKVDDDWLNPAWIGLLRWNKGEADLPAISNFNSMILSAIDLRDRAKEDGHFRHLMQSWIPNRLTPKDKRRLACPLRPWHTRNVVGDEVVSLIGTLHAQDPELLNDALRLFAADLEKGAFVRFDNIERLSSVDRYIQLLRRMGLGKRQIEVVSGDPDSESQYRRDWRGSLYESNMLIRPCDDSRNFGAKSSLSIRPDFFEARTVLGTGPAGFRFAMAMAFIVFGENANGPALR